MKRLQLPKNKFIRVAINVIFILFWSWFFISVLYSWWSFIVMRPFFNLFRCGIISWELLGSHTTPECADSLQAYGFGVFSQIMDWSALVLPSLLVTKLIWFPKRPKITRSKR